MLDFAALPARSAGSAPFDPGATASSGLPVTYDAGPPGVCQASNGLVHILGAGQCTVEASQPGNAEYEAAESVARTFSIFVPTLDVDASGAASTYDALSDGLLILRYLFGAEGTALTESVVGAGRPRRCGEDIGCYSTAVRAALDVDGNRRHGRADRRRAD
ncbi:MAG: hypothetical protein IPI73_30370 [Betaproteobacteria bacterium]|nr:hypothetical protein [Betaproteobacteria bacterium]